LAEYLSNVAFPDVNSEWFWIPSLLFWEYETTILTRSYGNFIFFQYLSNHYGGGQAGDEELIRLLKDFPGTGSVADQAEALASIDGMEDIYHRFVRDYTTASIVDTNGSKIPTEYAATPQVVTAPVDDLGTGTLVPFSVERYLIRVPLTEEGQNQPSATFASEFTGDGREGYLMESGDWAEELPSPLPEACGPPSEFVIVLTATTEGRGYHYEAPSVEDLECEEQPPCTDDCASSNGDPHMVTVDGTKYDFMSTGEFVLVRSPDGAVEIQVRQEPYPGEAAVTVNTAVAVRMGEQRLMIDAAPDQEEAQAFVDGTAMTSDSAVDFESGGKLTKIPSGYRVDMPDGTTLLAIGMAQLGLNAIVAPSDQLRENAQGLLGVVASGGIGVPALPDGSVLPSPNAGESTFTALYGQFADAWRISAETSLFDYPDGRSTADYITPGYPAEEDLVSPFDISPDARAAAEQACVGVADPNLFELCVYDVAITQQFGFAQGYEVTESVTVSAETPGNSTGLPPGVMGIVPDIERLAGAALADDGTLYLSYTNSSGGATLAAIDTATGVPRTGATVSSPGQVAVASGSPWAAAMDVPTNTCSVSRLDPASLAAVTTVATECGLLGLSQLVATDSAVWYLPIGGELTRIDVADGRTTQIALPASGGRLQSSPSTVFYDADGSHYRLVPGASAFEPMALQGDAFPGGDGLWADVDGQAGFFTSGSAPDRTIALTDDARLVGADATAIYVETAGAPLSQLVRMPADGSAATPLLQASEVQTSGGTASLDFAFSDPEESPLLIAGSVLAKLWRIPSLAEHGPSILVMQRADLP
jgi:hypothetical protein